MSSSAQSSRYGLGRTYSAVNLVKMIRDGKITTLRDFISAYNFREEPSASYQMFELLLKLIESGLVSISGPLHVDPLEYLRNYHHIYTELRTSKESNLHQFQLKATSRLTDIQSAMDIRLSDICRLKEPGALIVTPIFHSNPIRVDGLDIFVIMPFSEVSSQYMRIISRKLPMRWRSVYGEPMTYLAHTTL